MSSDRIALAEEVFAAIEAARCTGREGPYGLYDYSSYPGEEPPHVVRDFRDMRSADYGRFIFRSHDRDEAKAHFEELTRQHIGLAAIGAIEGSPVFAALRADHDAGGAVAMREAAAREAERFIIPAAFPNAPQIIHERVNRQNQVVPEIADAIRALPLASQEGSGC